MLAAAVRIRGVLRLDAFASLLLRQLGVPVSGVIFVPKIWANSEYETVS